MSPVRACFYLKARRLHWLSCRSASTDLNFILPDFSLREVSYAKSQVRVLLYPNCLNAQVSTTDGRSRGFTKTTLCDKQSFERVFPPTASKKIVAGCKEIKHVYPSFTPTKSILDFGPLYAQRVAVALRFCGILDSDVARYPQLVHLFSVNNFIHEMELMELEGLGLGELLSFARKGNLPVSEKFVDGFMKKLEYSLRELQLEGGLESIRNIKWDRSLTVSKFLNYCTREVCKEIAKTLPLTSSELNEAILVLGNNKHPFKNPINVARNYHLYQHYGRTNFKGTMKRQYFQNTFLRPDSMETVISMNAFYNYLLLEPAFPVSKEEFIACFRKNHINLQKSAKSLPITTRFKILEDMGFSKMEAFDILTSRNAPVLKKKLEDLSFSSHEFVSTMKYRLNMLRKNSAQIGLTSHTHFWCAMFNWPTAMKSLAGIMKNNESGGSLIAPVFSKNRSLKIVTVEALPPKSGNHPTISYLAKYFGYTKSEELSQLVKNAFPSICYPSVPTSRVHSVLLMLVDRGFTKEQIRKALPLLSYPLAMVEQKLDELKSEHADENDLVLPICLYCIEKEFNFTSDGLFAGLQKHTFSKELEKEIVRYCGEHNKEKKIEDRQIRQHQGHPQFKATNSFQRTSEQFLNAPSSYSVQQRHFHKVYSSGMTFQGPMQRLKVYLELQKLKNLWDSKFDKQEFEVGTKHVGFVCSHQDN